MEKALLTAASVAEYLDISPRQLARFRKRKDFPKPLIFNEEGDEMRNKKYWIRSTLDRWLEGLSKAQEKAN